MNVLHMVSWYFSGIEENPVGVFHTEAATYLKRYCNVAIYYPYERNIEEYYQKKEELGILTYRSKYKLENKLRNRINMFKTFKIIIRDFNPDIIHAHVGTEAGRFAVMLGKIFNIPVIITEHSSADISGVRSFPHHLYAYWAYKGSRYNACVSDTLTDDLSQIFPKFSFHTIYNGINLEDHKEFANKEYRICDRINIVMVAGMYDKWVKGIPVLLSALQLVKSKRNDFVIHFVGDGDYRMEFQEIASNLELDDVCIFHGQLQRNDVFSLVRQMDFLISTSRYESFGCSMAEAAMLGTPILATDSGGSKSIVTADNGMFISGYDELSISDSILKMMKCYPKFHSEENIKNARTKFSIESITKQYLEIYKTVIEDKQIRGEKIC